MPAHQVVLSIPEKFILSKDVEFEIKSDGHKLGSLLISKGNIEWKPANASKRHHRLTWEKFAEFMEEKKIVKK